MLLKCNMVNINETQVATFLWLYHLFYQVHLLAADISTVTVLLIEGIYKIGGTHADRNHTVLIKCLEHAFRKQQVVYSKPRQRQPSWQIRKNQSAVFQSPFVPRR